MNFTPTQLLVLAILTIGIRELTNSIVVVITAIKGTAAEDQTLLDQTQASLLASEQKINQLQAVVAKHQQMFSDLKKPTL